MWVWSSEHPGQVRVQADGDRLRVTARRTGPLGTRRCVAGGGALPDAVCVGRDQRRGLITFGGGLSPALPDRAGFVDVAADAGRGVVWVLDPVDRAVWALDAAGAVRGRGSVPESASRMGRLGADHLWVLAGTAPRLAVLPLDGRGVPGAPVGVPLEAPQRDAVWDGARGLLWTVGPEDRRVRRAAGPIEGAGSALVGRPLDALLRGDPRPALTLRLAPLGAVDATAVTLAGDRVVVAATGSDQVLVVMVGEDLRAAPQDGGLAPWALAPLGDRVVVASRLDDSVRLLGGPPLALDGAPRDTLEDVGERLFYGALLWERRPGSDVTCNTCHWEGGTDHRLHPGFHEERWEVTRPLWGMGAVEPVFSTGYAARLPDAVEGLVRTLDPRLWDPDAPPGWWLEPRVVRMKGGPRRLSPADVRLALLAWLRALPVPRPPLRAPGERPSPLAERGRSLFVRDCAACHRPAPTTRDTTVGQGAWPTDRPLVYGAPLFAHASTPPYTPDGNRVSPLLHPARGGPWLTSGAATTLEDVLRAFRPGGSPAHGAAGGGPYTEAEVTALRAWLLSM